MLVRAHQRDAVNRAGPVLVENVGAATVPPNNKSAGNALRHQGLVQPRVPRAGRPVGDSAENSLELAILSRKVSLRWC